MKVGQIRRALNMFENLVQATSGEGVNIFALLFWVALGLVAFIVGACIWHWWRFMRPGSEQFTSEDDS